MTERKTAKRVACTSLYLVNVCCVRYTKMPKPKTIGLKNCPVHYILTDSKLPIAKY